MKILYIGDNRNRENWGCRATSKALKDLISEKNDIIYTIYGDISYNIIPDIECYKMTFKKNLVLKLFNANALKKIMGIMKLDYITSDIDKSIKRFTILSKWFTLYKTIMQKISECDAVVLNGEGSFIFTTPYRRDSLFYLLIFKIAQRSRKKTYCLNAMFSDCPKSARNLTTLRQTIDVLTQCTSVVVRDIDSYNYLNQFNLNSINLKYVPDALFSWVKYEDYNYNLYKYPLGMCPFPEYDKYCENFDFSQPYICVSGSSAAAWSQEDACSGYIKLVQMLKRKNYRIFIIPTCSGDRFLYKVSEWTQVPIIPVKTNIYCGMSILANATAFLSGRWHPSILASIGGTPCVLFGSNSHKTRSFLKIMEYEKQREYKAIPSENEIEYILADLQFYIQEGESLRTKIRNKAKQLSELTNYYQNI